MEIFQHLAQGWCLYIVVILWISWHENEALDVNGQCAVLNPNTTLQAYEYLNNIFDEAETCQMNFCSSRINCLRDPTMANSCLLSGQPYVYFQFTSPREIHLIRVEGTICSKIPTTVFITTTDPPNNVTGSIMLKAEQRGNAALFHFLPPLVNSSLTVFFDTQECGNNNGNPNIKLNDIAIYSVPDHIWNIFSGTDIPAGVSITPSCETERPNRKNSTCAINGTNLDSECFCAFDEAPSRPTDWEMVTWTFEHGVAVVEIADEASERHYVLLYSRMLLHNSFGGCTKVEVKFFCGASNDLDTEDVCATCQVLAEPHVIDIKDNGEGQWVTIALGEVVTSRLCLDIRCTEGSKLVISVEEIEIYTQQYETTTPKPPATTTKEITTQRITMGTTFEPGSGLVIDCSFKLAADFVESYADPNSSDYRTLMMGIRMPIDAGFRIVYGDAFRGTSGYNFSQGSIQTNYVTDLAPDQSVTANQMTQLQSAIGDSLARANFSVVNGSWGFSPRPPDTAAPAPTKTEELLLAGILGAVVTLLFIALAVAAVAVRICIKRQKQLQNREEQHYDTANNSNPLQHYPYPYPVMSSTLPPPYVRAGSVSTHSQHSSIPAYFSSSLPRYTDPFNQRRNARRQRTSGTNDAFEFPTPIANGISGPFSDISDDNRVRTRDQNSSLTGYNPRRTQIPRPSLHHQSSSHPSQQYSRERDEVDRYSSLPATHAQESSYIPPWERHTTELSFHDHSWIPPDHLHEHRPTQNARSIPSSSQIEIEDNSLQRRQSRSNVYRKPLHKSEGSLQHTSSPLHRNGRALSTEDLFGINEGRRYAHRDDMLREADYVSNPSDSYEEHSSNRPRLRRSQSRDSGEPANDDFDDALTPYYISNEENESPKETKGGLFDIFTRTTSKHKSQDNLHRREPAYSHHTRKHRRRESQH